MARRDMPEFVFKGLLEEGAPTGKGSDDQSEAMGVRAMILVDVMAMGVMIAEDADGFPMDPTDIEEDQGQTPPPIWDDADKKVADEALKSTPRHPIPKSGDQRIITQLRQLGKGVIDPIKALATYHE